MLTKQDLDLGCEANIAEAQTLKFLSLVHHVTAPSNLHKQDFLDV